jgi:hypothetical protein
MGLADRDYMRDRHRAGSGVDVTDVPFTGPAEGRSAASILTMVLTWLLLLFALYKGTDWWLNQRPPSKATLPTIEVSPAPARPAPAPKQEPLSPLLEARPATPVAAPAYVPNVITKCTINGKTTYSDAVCPKGGVLGTVEIDTNQNVFEAPLMAPTRPSAQEPAPQQRTTDSGPNVNIHANRKAECELLEHHIARLDAWARQPQSAQSQDRIREERKLARDRQFQLRC